MSEALSSFTADDCKSSDLFDSFYPDINLFNKTNVGMNPCLYYKENEFDDLIRSSANYNFSRFHINIWSLRKTMLN